jgi:integrase/recombinase XerD
MASFVPALVRQAGEVPRLGEPLIDEYLRFVAARARANTLLAQMFDLKVFFTVVAKAPTVVTTTDVFAFIEAQRLPRRTNVIRFADVESGLAASTIKRRLASVSGLFSYLFERDLIEKNPVPHGLATRSRCSHLRSAPLIRTPRRLPRILGPGEVNVLLAALRTDRDRAMVTLMLFGGLRRSEVLGLVAADVHPGERRVFVSAGKGGHQRIVPVAATFFEHLGHYFDLERPDGSSTDHVFVVLKGSNRGNPLSAAGLDEILSGARKRAGLVHATCHELRHTCFTRLRESGMALEAIQAQAGHASIESTRIYLHLANDWLIGEYSKAMDILDGIGAPIPAGTE